MGRKNQLYVVDVDAGGYCVWPMASNAVEALQTLDFYLLEQECGLPVSIEVRPATEEEARGAKLSDGTTVWDRYQKDPLTRRVVATTEDDS